MSIKITRSSSELHPEGRFPFIVKTMEEAKGKYGVQIKWGMESKERREEDNEKFVLVYYTGTVLSSHPECKLSRLIECLGVSEEEFEEDTDIAIGMVFTGKVEHDEEGKHSNIVKVFPKDKLKNSGKGSTKEKKASNPDDPFDEE